MDRRLKMAGDMSVRSKIEFAGWTISNEVPQLIRPQQIIQLRAISDAGTQKDSIFSINWFTKWFPENRGPVGNCIWNVGEHRDSAALIAGKFQQVATKRFEPLNGGVGIRRKQQSEGRENANSGGTPAIFDRDFYVDMRQLIGIKKESASWLQRCESHPWAVRQSELRRVFEISSSGRRCLGSCRSGLSVCGINTFRKSIKRTNCDTDSSEGQKNQGPLTQQVRAAFRALLAILAGWTLWWSPRQFNDERNVLAIAVLVASCCGLMFVRSIILDFAAHQKSPLLALAICQSGGQSESPTVQSSPNGARMKSKRSFAAADLPVNL
jgi:hypothetical protein